MLIVRDLLQLYVVLLFLRILSSWIPVRPGSPLTGVMHGLYALTEPVLAPVRRVLPPLSIGGAGLDLSPMLVLVVLELIIGRL